MLLLAVTVHQHLMVSGKKHSGKPGNLYLRWTQLLRHLWIRVQSTNVQEYSDVLQKFVVLAYDKNIQTTDINKAREVLFSKGKRALDEIPTTAAALEQHSNRAFIQAAHIWGQALVKNPAVPSTASYGWKEEISGVIFLRHPWIAVN